MPHRFVSGNVFAGLDAAAAAGERVDTLLQSQTLRLERIVSKAYATPKGQWYDQSGPEWVMVLQGAAVLTLEGIEEPLNLSAGDYVLLPAHVRHRVEWTDATCDTVWLALHYSG